ncbi:hypothetical protein LOD99_11590 [Oopsacas minuta]|uniref:Uncharacterized protein n=1 Tax=Oopsacas minuta TaxID=111878 RepID=A0AAV7JKI0_9METZ|nr:hypothetical protein LOD99_11589 [Oopsacas minuta]KAI6649223.1 hypothetical protein LOD99_11590 [Oopsacas minuta]
MEKRWHVKDVKFRDIRILEKYKLKENDVLFLNSRELQNKLNFKKMSENEKLRVLKFRKRERSKVSQSNEMMALECSVDNLIKQKLDLLIEIDELQKEKEIYLIKNYLENENMNVATPQVSKVELDDVICSLGSVIGLSVDK